MDFLNFCLVIFCPQKLNIWPENRVTQWHLDTNFILAFGPAFLFRRLFFHEFFEKEQNFWLGLDDLFDGTEMSLLGVFIRPHAVSFTNSTWLDRVHAFQIRSLGWVVCGGDAGKGKAVQTCELTFCLLSFSLYRVWGTASKCLSWKFGSFYLATSCLFHQFNLTWEGARLSNSFARLSCV